MRQSGIVSFFDAIPDPRRGEGQRHDKTFILLLTLMGVMCGANGYRAVGDFIKTNRIALLRSFKPYKDRLPSFDTVRRLLIRIDFDQLSDAFYNWARTKVSLRKGEWLSMDGKALGGTMSNYKGPQQRFLILVSMYCSRSGLSLALSKVDSSKQSEGAVVPALIEALGIQGVVFTLDALHCPKKQ
jgi:hypothetical protein